MMTWCSLDRPCAAYGTLQAENLEQARLLGLSAEREAALLAEVERLRAEVARLRTPTWFYADGYEDRCLYSPEEAVDYMDPDVSCILEVACARPLPSIWCAVQVHSDPDADERFSITEHETQEEACAALKRSTQ